MSIFFLCILCAWLFVGHLLYVSLFLRKKANSKIMSRGLEDDMFEKRENSKSFRFLKGLKDFEDVYVKSKDQVRLHAYHILGDQNKWVVLYHDYLKEGKDMSFIAEYYLEKGYHILMIDARSHGKSAGKKYTMGHLEREDLNAWIFFIMSRHPKATIILHGIGMGASIILFNNFKYPQSVKGIVSDSAYTSLYTILNDVLREHYGILSVLLFTSFNLITKVRSGFSFKDLAVIDSVQKSKLPILFIHGKEDELVPETMCEILYNQTSSEKKLCLLKGEHGLSYMKDAKAYFHNLDVFLDKYMR